MDTISRFGKANGTVKVTLRLIPQKINQIKIQFFLGTKINLEFLLFEAGKLKINRIYK